MDDYTDLFNVNNVPTQQSTHLNSISSNNTTPNISNTSNNSISYTPDDIPSMQHSGNKASNPLLIIVILIGLTVLLYVFFTPSSNSNSSKSITNVKPSNTKENVTTSQITKKTNKPKVTDDVLDLGAVLSSNSILEWVNYSKGIYSNEYNVLIYYINCESAKLGNFTVEISYTEYRELEDAGILPLEVYEVKFKNSDKIYYMNFKLHNNWRALLNGDIK